METLLILYNKKPNGNQFSQNTAYFILNDNQFIIKHLEDVLLLLTSLSFLGKAGAVAR